MKRLSLFVPVVLLAAFALPLPATAQPADSTAASTPLEGTPITQRGTLADGSQFVARGDGVSSLLNALAAQMDLPVVVSNKAQKKRVEGRFALREPRAVLNQLSRDLGLVWYSDAQTLYVYDASEIRNALGHLQHASVAVLNDFLRRTRLADSRFPVRGNSADGTFYVTGPPVYVDIVLNAARYLDELYRDADAKAEHVEVIPLHNSFVEGRRYGMRDWQTTLPGMARILATMLGDAGAAIVVRQPETVRTPADPDTPVAAAPPPLAAQGTPSAMLPVRGSGAAEPRTIVVAYPETNSLLVRGTLSGIQKVKRLVAELDLPRRQVELSLWIIDIQKKELDALGVNWKGDVGVAGRLGVSFNLNGASSTLDGQRFLASVMALSERGSASIVSRPVLLTQENVLAHFDSNSTFYARLEAERAASLEAVTYGTLVSVLPRVSDGGEVEMQLKIEDGTDSGSNVEGLPVITRTSIDTVARVPHALSLLVGGYTRQEASRTRQAVPGLGRIPFIGGVFRNRDTRQQEQVRVFLIQPRVLHGVPADEGIYAPERRGSFGEQYQQLRERVVEDLDGRH
ncbi:type III secretion system outer membrane ring subunit SctC [Stenotrophomonas sp. NPDC077659]|uniref:type III secretion system outer membrane ring subunit SctC n=1 Tax=Stenotrophomonas sp. NPDC077659 TaxID=3390694 RepID=UPI003D0108FC